MRVGFDVRPGENGGIPGTDGAYPEADVVVTVGPGDEARLELAEWIDPVSVLYGLKFGYVPVDPADVREGSGTWVPFRMILNRPYTVPATGEERPTELADLSGLRWGTSDPDASGFDERNLVDGAGDVLELRIPWMMLMFADPSTRTVFVQEADGTVETIRIDRVGIAVQAGGELLATNGYSWDEWAGVAWHERRKGSWGPLRDAFVDASS